MHTPPACALRPAFQRATEDRCALVQGGAGEQASREALLEMRRIIGVLAYEGESDEALAPQPGVAALPQLAAQVTAAGVAIDLEVEGSERNVPAGLDLSAYRIVQEALTNTLKHAHATRAAVRIRYRPEAVEVEITDNGHPGSTPVSTTSPASGGSGRGLIGMQDVVMDIRMPILDGIEATRRLMAEPVPPRVLVLTTFDLDENLFRAMKAGASGFLLKDVRRGQLAAAIRAVMLGDALIDPQVTRRLIERFCLLPAPVSGTPGPLRSPTERELDVLRLLAEGLSNTDIATRLVVGVSTVKTHVAHIMTKLQLDERAQAVVLAYETGFVVPGGNGPHDYRNCLP